MRPGRFRVFFAGGLLHFSGEGSMRGGSGENFAPKGRNRCRSRAADEDRARRRGAGETSFPERAAETGPKDVIDIPKAL